MKIKKEIKSSKNKRNTRAKKKIKKKIRVEEQQMCTN